MPKPKKSAYMIFAVEWKNKHAKGMSAVEASQKVGKLWDALSEEERNSYKNRAKRENAVQAAKTNNQARTDAKKLENSLDTEDDQRGIQREIEKIVKQSVQNNKLIEQTYIFVMTQYFTKSLISKMVVPAEISLCKFSIQEGVYAKYHTYLNPDVNMYGHRYEAEEHSRSTHKLPIPPAAMGPKDLGRIYNDILDFVRNRETGEYLPLFTLDAGLEDVKGCIDFLRTDCDARNEALKIFPLKHLFYILKTETAIAGDVEKPQNRFTTDVVLDRDLHEYESNMGCEFHEENDNTKYCTQSCVTRWGYIFADYMCDDVAVTPRPGRHIPIRANLSVILNQSNFGRTNSKTDKLKEDTK